MTERPHSVALALAIAAGIAASPAAAQQQDVDLDLARVTLYRSGVGYFELRGAIEGDADATLRFNEEHVNDILKSLVTLDLGGGTIEAAAYDSDDPLEKRLASFAVDLAGDPSLAGLLRQLRGERVRLELVDRTVTGTVVSVETREAAVSGVKTTRPFVTVFAAAGLRSVAVDDLLSVEILDERLAAELSTALSAIASDNAGDLRSVDLKFRGAGARRVVVGYVHEAPVWKTSYRLVLAEGERASSATLQGWAIVENTTDDDWQNVSLSLVSGRPVSFSMDLAEPLYLDRPAIPVPIEVAAAPRNYESTQFRAEAPAAARLDFDDDRLRRLGRAERQSSAAQNSLLATEPLAERGSFEALPEAFSTYAPRARATADEVGEVFRYTLDLPVTIERRRSAMLPIVTTPVQARRVSIFDTRLPSAHPMRGVEIENDTELKLMPGPIAVYDTDAYAGDASIRHVAPGDSRLLSYAVDLDVTVSSNTDRTSEITKVRIDRGVLIREIGQQWRQAFTVANTDHSRGRTVIIEIPVLAGWTLASPAGPTQQTATALRFEVEVDAGATRTLDVLRERTDSTAIAITGSDLGELLSLRASSRVISSDVRDAIRRVQELNAQVAAATSRIDALTGQRGDIENEQRRIRQNMQAVDRTSDLYRRYVQKLGEQESRLEELAAAINAARAERDGLEQRRREKFASLSVD